MGSPSSQIRVGSSGKTTRLWVFVSEVLVGTPEFKVRSVITASWVRSGYIGFNGPVVDIRVRGQTGDTGVRRVNGVVVRPGSV